MKGLLACVLSLSLASPARGVDESRTSPEEFLKQWAQAWSANEIQRMMSFYEDSEDLVVIASSGAAYKGTDGLRKMYKAAFEEANWNRVMLENLQVREERKIAWATGRFQANLQSQGREFRFTSQGTFVLRRGDGGWKIVLEHFSPIADVPRVQRRN